MSARLVTVPDDLAQLAAEASRASGDEPFRGALETIRARLSATAIDRLGPSATSLAHLVGRQPWRARASAEPYADKQAFRADLDVVDAALRANADDRIADDRLLAARESALSFGFNLSGLDASELRGPRDRRRGTPRVGGRPRRLSRPVGGRARGRAHRGVVVATSVDQPRRGPERFGRQELTIVRAAATAVATFGPEAVPNYVISIRTSVSDMLEALILLKEAGLYDAGTSGEGARSQLRVVPLFETIEDLQQGARRSRGLRVRALPGGW